MARHKSIPGLLDEPPISIYPSLAERAGINKAALLQQLHFLVQVSELAENERNFQDGRWWVYNTYANWHRKYFRWLNKGTIQRLFLELEKDGIVLSCAWHGDPSGKTKAYAIDYDYWDDWLAGQPKQRNGCPSQNVMDPAPPDPSQNVVDADPAGDEDPSQNVVDCDPNCDGCGSQNVAGPVTKCDGSPYITEIPPEITSQRSPETPPPPEESEGTDRHATEPAPGVDGGGLDERYIRKRIMLEFEKEGVWARLVQDAWTRYGPVNTLALLRECQATGRVPAALFSTKVSRKASPLPAYVEQARRWIEMRLIERDSLPPEPEAEAEPSTPAAPQLPALKPGAPPKQTAAAAPPDAAAGLETRPGGSGRFTIADAWCATLNQLEVQLGRATYSTWLKGAQAVSYVDGVVTVDVRHHYAPQYLTQHLQHVVDRCMTQFAGAPTRVAWQVAAAATAAGKG